MIYINYIIKWLIFPQWNFSIAKQGALKVTHFMCISYLLINSPTSLDFSSLMEFGFSIGRYHALPEEPKWSIGSCIPNQNYDSLGCNLDIGVASSKYSFSLFIKFELACHFYLCPKASSQCLWNYGIAAGRRQSFSPRLIVWLASTFRKRCRYYYRNLGWTVN
jgi:hypothetical protein